MIDASDMDVICTGINSISMLVYTLNLLAIIFGVKRAKSQKYVHFPANPPTYLRIQNDVSVNAMSIGILANI
jgi:hypothetical protein